MSVVGPRPICPALQLSRTLSAPSTSCVLVPASNSQPPLVIAGTDVGEVNALTLGVVVSEFSCRGVDSGAPRVHCITARTPSAVTALARGVLTRTGPGEHREEIVAISADGCTQCFFPPNYMDYAPRILFTQIIQANITSAIMLDVDKDGNQELVVVMTDRVVRSFRYDASRKCLVPINKWEVPAQISAFSIGESVSIMEAWLAQLSERAYICLALSGSEQNGSVRSISPENKCSSVVMVPYRSEHIHIMGSLISNIIIIANQKERVLVNPGWSIIAADTVRLASFNIVVSLDANGLILIYGFNERNIKDTSIEALFRFEAVPDSDRLCLAVSEDHLVIAIATMAGRVVVYSVALKSIKAELTRR